MRWADVLFAHWGVDPAVVDEQLPPSVSADTFDGTAYLGVVGFRMENIRPRGSPVGLTFPELNLRTYVDGADGPGIYFFNLDADDRVGVSVARRVFELPYYRADMAITETDGEFRLTSHRTHDGVPSADFDGTYRPVGDPAPAEAGSLAAFLTERYRFYAAADGGQLYAGTIKHPQWRLQDATLDIERNDLFDVNGFERPDAEPLVHYSPGVDVTAGLIHQVTDSEPVSGTASTD